MTIALNAVNNPSAWAAALGMQASVDLASASSVNAYLQSLVERDAYLYDQLQPITVTALKALAVPSGTIRNVLTAGGLPLGLFRYDSAFSPLPYDTNTLIRPTAGGGCWVCIGYGFLSQVFDLTGANPKLAQGAAIGTLIGVYESNGALASKAANTNEDVQISTNAAALGDILVIRAECDVSNGSGGGQNAFSSIIYTGSAGTTQIYNVGNYTGAATTDVAAHVGITRKVTVSDVGVNICKFRIAVGANGARSTSVAPSINVMHFRP